MKTKIFFLNLLFSSFHLMAGELVLEGTYFGKNVYVQNPGDENGGFCTKKVIVNGKEVPFNNTGAFEIDLKGMDFKLGDSLKIVLVHSDNCKPKVIFDNSKPKSTFEIVNMEVSTSGLLKWTTKGEISKFPFVVEQFRWNKWIKVGEVFGKGGGVVNSYEFQVPPHSGENKVRVKQVDFTVKANISKPVMFSSTVEGVVMLDGGKGAKKILFSGETMYELWDGKANLVRRGSGSFMDVAELKQGIYYLNYDNKSVEIVLKK